MTLMLVVVVLVALSVITPLYSFFAIRIFDFDPEIISLSRHSIMILTPSIVMLAYRRFYQGVLVSQGAQRFIFRAIFLRVLATIVAALILVNVVSFPSSYTVSLSLTLGVVVEAIVSKLFSVESVKKILQSKDKLRITLKDIAKFYYPIALTTMTSIATVVIATLFINHSKNPIVSLAVFPVVNSFVLIFKTTSMSFQDVILYFYQLSEDFIKPLRRFAILITIIMTLAFAVVAFTPLAMLYLTKINSLDPGLDAEAIAPLRAFVLYPMLSLLVVWQRALLIHKMKTAILSWSVGVEIIILILVFFVLISLLNINGVVAAAFAFTAGRLVGLAILYWANHFWANAKISP